MTQLPGDPDQDHDSKRDPRLELLIPPDWKGWGWVERIVYLATLAGLMAVVFYVAGKVAGYH